MKKFKTRTIRYRRIRECKTNYQKRLKLLLSSKTRIVVRRSSKYIVGQVIEYSPNGDLVKTSVTSKNLIKFGWKGNFNNIPAAYLTGLMLAKKTKGIDGIFDIGMQTSLKGNVIYSFAKGCIDGGLKISCSDKIFPDENKISGKHIADFAASLKKDKDAFNKQFGKVMKNIDPEKIVEHFKEVKQKILEK